MDQQKSVSKAVIARLPRYYRYLRRLGSENVSRISSKDLAARMGLTASQIRQDLSCFGGFGQQGYGYSVETLIIELERILGIAGSRRAMLFGAGNLGRALLRNFNFSYCGVRPVAAFDIAPDIVGNAYRGIPVYASRRISLCSVCRVQRRRSWRRVWSRRASRESGTSPMPSFVRKRSAWRWKMCIFPTH